MPERDAPLLFDQIEREEPAVPLPPLTPFEEVLADYRTAGLTLRAHPMSFFREQMDRLKITPANRLPELKNDIFLRVGGIVLLRQRPSTAKGITFVTLEDETGMVNLIVRMEVWERYRKVARTAVAMIAHGRLQIDRDSGIVHVLVTRMEDLSDKLANLETSPRNFH
jgi:error-prone DNA polymerase